MESTKQRVRINAESVFAGTTPKHDLGKWIKVIRDTDPDWGWILSVEMDTKELMPCTEISDGKEYLYYKVTPENICVNYDVLDRYPFEFSPRRPCLENLQLHEHLDIAESEIEDTASLLKDWNFPMAGFPRFSIGDIVTHSIEDSGPLLITGIIYVPSEFIEFATVLKEPGYSYYTCLYHPEGFYDAVGAYPQKVLRPSNKGSWAYLWPELLAKV